MAGLQCVCGEAFTASCDIEPTESAFAWIMLLMSAIAHAVHYCGDDGCDSSDDEPTSMYS